MDVSSDDTMHISYFGRPDDKLLEKNKRLEKVFKFHGDEINGLSSKFDKAITFATARYR